MTTINVLVAVNVGQAAIAQNLNQYVFMEDSTGYSGNGSSGQELVTTCTNGDTVIWQVVSIDPSETVVIVGFTGAAIPNMINPVQYPQYDGTVWGGSVNSAGTTVQYSLSLVLNGDYNTPLQFDPYLTANDPQNLR